MDPVECRIRRVISNRLNGSVPYRVETAFPATCGCEEYVNGLNAELGMFVYCSAVVLTLCCVGNSSLNKPTPLDA